MAPIAAAQPAITAMPTAAAVEPSITAMPTAAELEPSTSAVPSLAEVEPAAGEVEPLVGPAMPAGAGEMPPGSYELVAGRFTHFSDLGAFSETLQALPGVRSMSTQQFVRGMVSLRVHYDNPIPLLTRLRELQQFRPDVREIGPSQIEMVIFAGPQAAPAPAAAPAVVARPKPTVLEEAEAVASHAWSAPAPALAAGLLHPTAVTECVTPGSGKFAVNARALAMATTVAAAAVGLLASLLGL